MNAALIGELVTLRYKLLWAKTRSRNGRIALFLAGYLLLIALIALLTSGGVGAAIFAVRSGHGEKIAQAVLTAIFFEAVLASNILGFGMNAIFSDLELRRYPLTAAERRLTRHLIGIVDPFWFLFLGLQLGLALGLYGAGVGSFWFGLIAVLLLFVSNYLLARFVALAIDRLMQRKSGAAILLGGVMLLAFLPSVLAPLIKKNPAMLHTIVERMAYTPPFAAAAAMMHPDATGIRGLGVLLLWSLGFVAALVWIENRPPQRRLAESVKVEWEGPTDRVAAYFGPDLAPFVAHWLRFYLRNSRTRILSVIGLPAARLSDLSDRPETRPPRPLRRRSRDLRDDQLPRHLAHCRELFRLLRRRLPPLFPAARAGRRHGSRRQLCRAHTRRRAPADCAPALDRPLALPAGCAHDLHAGLQRPHRPVRL